MCYNSCKLRTLWFHIHFVQTALIQLMNRSVSSNYHSPCFVPTQIFVATIAFLLPSAEHSTVEADKKVHVGKERTWNVWDLKALDLSCWNGAFAEECFYWSDLRCFVFTDFLFPEFSSLVAKHDKQFGLSHYCVRSCQRFFAVITALLIHTTFYT